ncbi:DUF4190 domain-containing protein [Mycobacterium shigaense]|uniref:DUF4190 domain-containing protein n=1 Tax=Mycobacterium shigaense TaxID=722731 RepID=A0A1Z4EN28_9MYCO|nr:DUF4190 domain-containing protein [Mycobacterium shigaense]MEA1120518.1 DUF4190 domain-containing protein [Mycobacterium shigaense]PRI14251.1 DUF4190 domain-containing protein [Mycobacterium shigaense]BAX94413.1 DUF4190 domain-containing protein [Mycobacterium shigaense]
MSRPDAPKNQIGVASLILGAASLLTCWLMIGVPLGVAAVVTGDIGRGRANRGEATNGRVAVAGILLGIVAIAAGLAAVGYYAWVDSKDPGWFQRCVDDPATNNC